MSEKTKEQKFEEKGDKNTCKKLYKPDISTREQISCRTFIPLYDIMHNKYKIISMLPSKFAFMRFSGTVENMQRFFREVESIIDKNQISYNHKVVNENILIERVEGHSSRKIALMCPHCFNMNFYHELTNGTGFSTMIKRTGKFFNAEFSNLIFSYDKLDLIFQNMDDITKVVSDAYNGVCGLCEAEVTFIPIDYYLAPAIYYLNIMGFETVYSCQGHVYEDGSQPYIYFKNKDIIQYFDKLPDTWYFDVAEFKDSNKVIIRADGDTIEQIAENILDLYEWICTLPFPEIFPNFDQRSFIMNFLY